MIRKVFLSHSSDDKKFIDSVYEKLPSVAVYDKYSFHTGDEFVKIIKAFLEETAIFVLFVSQKSLNAPWVKYEIDQAILLKIHGKIDHIICIIIDDSKITEMPEYLRSNNIYRTQNPKDAAATIQSILNKTNESSLIYLGRNLDADLAEEKLLPLNPEETPYVFSLYGLPGIGRKSFFKNTIIPLEKHKFFKPIIITVEDGESVFSLSAKMLSYLISYSCYEDYHDYTKNLQLSTEDDIISEIMGYVPRLLEQQSLFCFCEFDYILDDNGYVREDFSKLFDKIRIPQLLFITISRRKVTWPSDTHNIFFKLNGLREDDIRRIIIAYMDTRCLNLSSPQIKAIADCASGHPGIAKKIVDMVQEYGFELIMDDKEKIKAYSNAIFAQHITSYLKSEHAKKILSILNWFSAFPFAILNKLFPEINCNSEICSLVDKCIVEIEPETDLISIPLPLMGTISRSVSLPSNGDMKQIASLIRDYYAKNNSGINVPLALAMARIMGIIELFIPDDKNIHDMAFVFDADLVKKVKQYYSDDMYDEAISLAKKILKSQAKNKNQTVLNILIKSYVEKNKFSEAIKLIDEAENYNWLSAKNICMLRGFCFERTNYLEKAIAEYENARSISPKDVYANMELAKCYMVKHEYKMASAIIERIQSNPLLVSRNKLLDCAIKILTRTGKIDEAEALLKSRALLGEDKYYYIRLSDWYHAKGNIDLALVAAQKANGAKYFPKYMQLASLLFEKHDLDKFKKNLDYIEDMFPFKRDNEIIFLKSKLFILQENYKLAYELVKNCPSISPITRDQISYLCLTKLHTQNTIRYADRLRFKKIKEQLETEYIDRLPLLKSLYFDAI